MTKNLSIIPAASIDLEKMALSRLHQLNHDLIKCDITYNQHSLLIQGPKMFLGSSIAQCDNHFYIDLTFNHSHSKFLKCVNNIDCLAMIEISDNCKQWYQGADDISLTQIEHEYIPSVKSSSIHTNRYSMKLKIPCDQIEFFDQDNIPVPYQLIKENYTVIPLLNLCGLYKDNQHIWADWGLPQLKIELLDNLLKGCQLIDIEESEDEAIPEDEPDT